MKICYVNNVNILLLNYYINYKIFITRLICVQVFRDDFWLVLREENDLKKMTVLQSRE